jgi:hydrogenase expression/formation protein HypE
MCGSIPLYLSAGLVIEEGFSMEDLKKVLKSMNAAARNAGVKVVTGDTKVVPRAVVDKIFINTSGIGRIPEGVNVSCDRACPGDKVILSGSIGDHGATILTQREEMRFNSPVVSDTAALNQMVKRMLSVCQDIHVLRDPTRGGVGTALNEIAEKSEVGIRIYETQIPIKDEVAGICELLGLDPLYVANEGKLLAFVQEDHAEEVLEAVKEDTFGKDAIIIGEVVADNPKKVFMKTLIGGTRIVDMLTAEQLPRIC